MEAEVTPARRARLWGLSPNVLFLGLVSFFTDVSSDMVFPLLPLFLANVLGARAAVIGLVEGVGESTATLLKLGSGWLSDRLGKRKALLVLGYGLSTLAKPFLYIANSWGAVLAIRFSDRTGKGIRTAPRDALVADSSEARIMGRSFGFHRALDTMGAALGLAVAAGVVYFLQREDPALTLRTYRALVLVAIVPAVLAVIIALAFVREVAPRPVTRGTSSAAASALPRSFPVFLGIMVVFTLGNSSDAFLVLRAQNLGLSVVEILVLLVLFNGVYALVSGPAGALSDRWGRKRLVVAGWGVYALVYLGFALAGASWQVWPLFLLYGLYHAGVEGVARAWVADMVAPGKRGTAYGIYHGALGASTLLASVLAGWLWQAIDPAAPFFLGAALAALSALALVVLVRPSRA